MLTSLFNVKCRSSAGCIRLTSTSRIIVPTYLHTYIHAHSYIHTYITGFVGKKIK